MYIDLKYMLDRLGEKAIRELTQSDEAPDVIDESKVNCCIADAEALVNSKCSSKYSAPFQVAPEEIKRLTFNIARYYLFTYFRTGAFAIEKERQDPIYIDYQSALIALDEIESGTRKVIVPSEANDFKKAIRANKNPRLFTNESLKYL